MSRPVEDLEAHVLQRLAVVEEAIRLQVVTGATHLQQLEMAPEAYGLTAAVREPVRRLRRRRNGALHGALPAWEPPPEAHCTTPPPTSCTADVGVQVEGPVAGESTTGPTTQLEAEEPHCPGGPAGESTGPAAWLTPPPDAQQPQLDHVPLSDVSFGDRVKVWSYSAHAWVPAVVTNLHHDGELVVRYRNSQGCERERDLPRDHSELRPFLPVPGGG